MPTIEIIQSGAASAPAWWVPLVPPLATGAVAVFAVWLTARFAAARNHNDRIWDRRVAAYSTIFEALHQMTQMLDAWEREYFRNVDPAPEEEAKRGEEYRAAKARLLATLAREQWMLDDVVASAISEMTKAMDTRKPDFFSSIDEDGAAIGKATAALRAHARQELMRPRLLAVRPHAQQRSPNTAPVPPN